MHAIADRAELPDIERVALPRRAERALPDFLRPQADGQHILCLRLQIIQRRHSRVRRTRRLSVQEQLIDCLRVVQTAVRNLHRGTARLHKQLADFHFSAPSACFARRYSLYAMMNGPTPLLSSDFFGSDR